MKFILGKKVSMTQLFDEKGVVTPVTMVEIGSNTVIRTKSVETDGYAAVQIGYGSRKESRVSKAELGSTGGKAYEEVQEFRIPGNETFESGAEILVSTFEKGDDIIVTGTSKAKGFQGVVKRHGFHGGPRTHGQKHSEREPGSIGGGLRTRVPKGMRMAGRTGGDTVTVKGLKIVAVDTEKNLLFISGAVPGRRGTLISIVG